MKCELETGLITQPKYILPLNIHSIFFDVNTQMGPNTVAFSVFGPMNDFVLHNHNVINNLNNITSDDSWIISSQNDIRVNASSVVLEVTSIVLNAQGDIGSMSC